MARNVQIQSEENTYKVLTDIKNKLKQIPEGSMSHHFYTDSIRHCSLEYLMKTCMY